MNSTQTSNSIGLKRICTNCGVRFYDLNNRPIICPSCDTEFTGEVKVKGRRSRTNAINKKENTKEEEELLKKRTIVADREEDSIEEDLLEDEDDGVEVVSLEDNEDSKINIEETPEIIKSEDDDLENIPDFEDDIGDDLDDSTTLLDEDED